MRLLLIGSIALSFASCGGSAPAASGALELELEEARLGADVIDARVATAVEVLRSRPILDRVVRELALDHVPALGPDPAASLVRAVNVSRRGASLVLDVAVTLDDPEESVRVCNALLGTYVESILEAQLRPIMDERTWISAQLEALADGPEGAAQRERLLAREAQLELEQNAARGRAGARVLEPCARRAR